MCPSGFQNYRSPLTIPHIPTLCAHVRVSAGWFDPQLPRHLVLGGKLILFDFGL